jgi:hypothetical protein
MNICIQLRRDNDDDNVDEHDSYSLCVSILVHVPSSLKLSNVLSRFLYAYGYFQYCVLILLPWRIKIASLFPFRINLCANYAYIFLERGIAMWQKKGFVNVGCTTQFENFSSCLLTNWLTVWCRVLLEKSPFAQLLKIFPTFYGPRSFITVFTRTLHWFRSWARWIQPIPPILFLWNPSQYYTPIDI